MQVEKQFGILGPVGVSAASAVQPSAEGASQGGREDPTMYDQPPQSGARGKHDILVDDQDCSVADAESGPGSCGVSSHDEL